MNLDTKRWLILAAGVLANLCQGAAYASSVFAKPMLAHLGCMITKTLPVNGVMTQVTIPDIMKWTIAFSINLASLPIGMLLSGKIADKHGSRIVVVMGGILFGLGMFLSGYANSLTWFYLTFGLMMGLGSGAAYGAIVSTSVRWFPDFRGLASGLAVGALGFGSFVIAPVADSMIDPKNPSSVLFAFKALGAAFLVIISIASVVLKNPPADYKPAGFNPKTPAAKGAAKKDLEWTQMLGTGKFWVLFLMYACGAFAGLMVISQASPIAQTMTKDIKALADFKEMGKEGAAIAAILGLANAAGRILWGAISDRIGRLMSVSLMFVLTASSMFLLPNLVTAKMTFIWDAIIIGFCYGGYLGTFPSLCADAFGIKNMAVNYALLFLSFGIAGAAGPIVGAAIFKSTGGYGQAFTIAGIVAVVGALLSIGLQMTEKKSSSAIKASS